MVLSRSEIKGKWKIYKCRLFLEFNKINEKLPYVHGKVVFLRVE